ncbi:MAG: LPXTG cell wall anchor domain-containing protein, partial [Clostridiales Family XIII bacterium]|nr:LPXTG cell wall anchor domain-containing protein [Clostridiales Family XIII bacterium]
LTQANVEKLISALETALAGLRHDHPIIEQSTPEIITSAGTGVSVKLKGYFSSVKSVTLNDAAFELTAESESDYGLTMDGRRSGTLTEGSAIVTLTSDFVDGLENGTYTIQITFDDGYKSGTGIAVFKIDRPKPGGNTDAGVKTGDDSAIGLSILTLLLATAILLFLLAARRRRERDADE